MFKKYSSIENTFRKEFLDKIKEHGYWDETYIVQEKVHGANLSFWTTDGVEFVAAKRTGILEPDENFYNFKQVLEEIKPKLQGIWKDIKSDYNDLKEMAVFGELFGGNYPHPEVKKVGSAIKLQQGIYYSPRNMFYAFDILINGEKYLDVEYANKLFEKHGLLYAKTLFSGTLEECLKYPNDFDSVIPAQLGLPEIKPNICEGVVIRPARYLKFNNNTRVILKNKNEKWAETIKPKRKARKPVKLPENVVKLQDAILNYVTENRLSNVISKIGEVSIEDFSQVISMFNRDIIEDFKKDYHKELEELDKKEIKLVTKSFMPRSAEMVRKRLKSR